MPFTTWFQFTSSPCILLFCINYSIQAAISKPIYYTPYLEFLTFKSLPGVIILLSAKNIMLKSTSSKNPPLITLGLNGFSSFGWSTAHMDHLVHMQWVIWVSVRVISPWRDLPWLTKGKSCLKHLLSLILLLSSYLLLSSTCLLEYIFPVFLYPWEYKSCEWKGLH